MTLRIVWFFLLVDATIGARSTNCPNYDIKFEKVLGLRPSDSYHLQVLIQADRFNNTPITIQCIEKCQANRECKSFVLYYNTTTCYWYKYAIEGAQELESMVDTNVAWFIKVCLRVEDCSNLWVFERVPGATLVGDDTKVLPNAMTRTQCQQNCLDEKEFGCRSAKFKITSGIYGPAEETTGICVLSKSDRGASTGAYRASGFDEEYFENQCADAEIDQEHQFCSYEEYDNATLSHNDLYHPSTTKDSCQQLCESTEAFNCRGYSLTPDGLQFECWLHSEDSKVHGPRLLQESPFSKYFERAPCLSISITCTETYITVSYSPKTSFGGRMYMQSYSEQPECTAQGHGKSPVALKLSVLSRQCGLRKAEAPDNRTLMGGIMILQYNPLVQTQGDRTIRIGCIYTNDSTVLIGTGITITSASNQGSLLTNATNAAPTPLVEMRVLDLNTQQEVSSTQIGQELQLVVELVPGNGSLDIWASHLVAMTENSEESILLLDDRACPTNLNIFPALEKFATNDTKKLVGSFQAFKFSSSAIVRFSVIVQFCPEYCPPINCGNAGKSVGRKRRTLEARSLLQAMNGTKVITVNRTDFERGGGPHQMPLEYIMIVRGSAANSDKLVWGDSKILVAGYDYSTNEVCLNYSLFIGLIMTWIFVQIIFFVCGIILVRRYKAYYENEITTQSLEQLHKNFDVGFSNLENRRVHWADNGHYS